MEEAWQGEESPDAEFSNPCCPCLVTDIIKNSSAFEMGVVLIRRC